MWGNFHCIIYIMAYLPFKKKEKKRKKRCCKKKRRKEKDIYYLSYACHFFRVSEVTTFSSRMANNVTATKEVTRRTFTCSFFREDITPLIRLSTSVTGHNLDEFRKTYGHILHMLTSRVDEWALYTLL